MTKNISLFAYVDFAFAYKKQASLHPLVPSKENKQIIIIIIIIIITRPEELTLLLLRRKITRQSQWI